MASFAPLWVRSGELAVFWQATDEFDNSPGGRSALLLGVILSLVVIAACLAGVKAWERSRSRGRVIRASAEAEGFDFFERGNRTLDLLRFDVFMEATGFEASSIVTTKRPDGRRLFAFDYQLINEFELYKSPDGRTHRRRRGDPNTIGGAAVGREVDRLEVFGAAATVSISSFLRNVVVQPFDWHVSPASRLPAGPAACDLDETFLSMYRVRADDTEFAQRFLNAHLTQLLVRTGGKFGLEIRGHNLLLFANHIEPGDMCDMAILIGVFADRISPDLLADYPEVIGIESDGSPRLGVISSSVKPAPGASPEKPFPIVEQTNDQRGPVLPATLSGRTVPVLSSEPQLPIDSAALPQPRQGAAVPEEPETVVPPVEPAPTEKPAETAPDSVDWSM